MRILSEREALISESRMVCRQGIWTTIALTSIFLMTPAIVKVCGFGSDIFWTSAGFCALLSGFSWHIAKSTLLQTNWVIRATDQGVFVKVRSYLNHQFSLDDKVVLFFPYSEIFGAVLFEETNQQLGIFNQTKIEKRQHLDFFLGHEVTEEIRDVIVNEVYREPSERLLGFDRLNNLHVQAHTPTPGVLRIPWHDKHSNIQPSIQKFLGFLATKSIPIEVFDSDQPQLLDQEKPEAA